MREYAKVTTPSTRELLERVAARPDPKEYRQLMFDLGVELAHVLNEPLGKPEQILLICTNEDADFLARGVLEELERSGHTKINLACFWNERERLGPDLDVAPIVRRYVEPTPKADVFIVVKSIISSACTVRTNVSELVYDLMPTRIFVVAPVILAGSTKQLEGAFDRSIAETFEYVWFAQDDQKEETGNVVPGIGGSVYELLDIGTASTKNSFTPEIVRTRRLALNAAE